MRFRIYKNIFLNFVDARLKQRCINVVPTLCNIVSTLRNVVSTLLQRRALTLYQRCATLKIWRRILFHFQRRINVISTLIRHWNVGWVFSYQAVWYFKIGLITHDCILRTNLPCNTDLHISEINPLPPPPPPHTQPFSFWKLCKWAKYFVRFSAAGKPYYIPDRILFWNARFQDNVKL